MGNEGNYVVTSKSYTAVAVNTASKAGEWVKSKLGGFSQLNTKYTAHDLVTEVDKGSEALIRNLIHTYFPEHAILGEEGVGPGPEAAAEALKKSMEAEYLWIVDPIDGTTNFVHGFPFFSISIALAHKGELIVGVVYDPSLDEMFVAEKGKGAYLRGKKISVSREKTLSESLVATGFPASQRHKLSTSLQAVDAIGSRARNIRNGGSAALHLAYVAAGRLSGFWEPGLNPWDVAAGALLVQEAGGSVTDFQGNPFTLGTGDILATNGNIHDEMSRLLKSFS